MKSTKMLHGVVLSSLVLVAAKSAAETIIIDGKPIELPDSVVGQVLTNRDVSRDLAALEARTYVGGALGRKVRELAKRIRSEGPTNQNLAELTELEKQVAQGESPMVVPAQNPARDPRNDEFQAAIRNGFDTGLGFKLALGEADRNAFTQMLVLVTTALEKGVITKESPQVISDLDGQPHTLTTDQFTSLMLAYGAYYKHLWDRFKAVD
jgi:hypothetical protein